MWKQALVCLLLRFGVEGKALSGSNETVRLGRSLLQAHAVPATRFRCREQQFPGIFADVETGCQVFHFCESAGTNSTFSCPNLTLFNQQYFVCDWAYNVRCEISEQFYSLNRDLYITPETIGAPLSALKHQPKSLQLIDTPVDIKASGSEVSRSLSSLVSQLESRSSSLVEDNNLGDLLSSGYRPGNPALGTPGSISNQGQDGVPEGEPVSGPQSTVPPTSTPASLGADTTSPGAETTSLVADPTSPPVDQIQLDDAADPEPDVTYVYEDLPTYVSAPLPAYKSEPLPTYVSQPLPTYVNEPLPTYVSEPLPSYVNEPLPTYSSNSAPSYSSDVDYSADPEPASYYAAQASAYSGSYAPYDSADPEPAAYYDSADPEPAAYYDSADPEPASYYAAVQTIDLSSGGDYDAVADPEPNSVAYSVDPNQAGAKPSGYRLFSSAGSSNNFYNGYANGGYVVDNADPEPDPEYSPYS